MLLSYDFIFIFVCVSQLSLQTHSLRPSTTYPLCRSVFYIMEGIIVGFFTIEYLLRFFASPYKLRFLIGFMNIIDLLAVLPFYLTLIIGSGISGIAVIRVIRLTRVLRLLKLGKHSAGAMVRSEAVSCSKKAVLFLFFVTICFFYLSLEHPFIYSIHTHTLSLSHSLIHSLAHCTQ
jgi:Ion transport protein